MGGRSDRPSAVPPVGGLPYVIRVARTGGFAGLRREWAIEVTGPDDDERWRPLIESCPWQDANADGFPDGFVYDVRVAGRKALVPESKLEGPWRRLVDEVRRHAG